MFRFLAYNGLEGQSGRSRRGLTRRLWSCDKPRVAYVHEGRPESEKVAFGISIELDDLSEDVIKRGEWEYGVTEPILCRQDPEHEGLVSYTPSADVEIISLGTLRHFRNNSRGCL